MNKTNIGPYWEFSEQNAVSLFQWSLFIESGFLLQNLSMCVILSKNKALTESKKEKEKEIISIGRLSGRIKYCKNIKKSDSTQDTEVMNRDDPKQNLI